MSYLSVLSRAIRSYAFSQRAVAVFAMCDHCWKQSEAERRGSSVGGEAGSGVRGPVPGRGEEAGNKKSPFAKEEQRGNVNTGSFRMSSGAVHVALAISVGSKSGAGHRGFRPAGKQDRGRVPVPGRGEKADDKKSPFVKGGQRGNVCTGFFRMRNGSGCNGCGLCYFCRK